MREGYITVVLGYLLLVVDALLTDNKSLTNISFSRYRRDSAERSCTLPHYPEHGYWRLLGGVAKPGDKISENSIIKFECALGYKLSIKNPHWVCGDKWGLSDFPECEELCPPLYSSSIYDLDCHNKRGQKIKCHEATHGTYVEYTCAKYYETPFGYKKTLVCTDKKWNQRPICQPTCGKKIEVQAKTLIFGTKPNEKLEYPWVTALYKRKGAGFEYICGGSILSLTVVLTAAHCVANDYGNAFPEKDFRVGAGKLYSKYNATEDEYAQYLDIKKIIVHENYKGDERRYLADIAVLVVKGEFVLNDVVQPICFSNMNSIFLHPGKTGEVSGFGEAENETISEKLRTLKIPYKYETTCAHELPAEWASRYNIIDKICAGFINQSTGLCDGDSGSGLAFNNTEDNRYYIHGIVSLAVFDKGHCDIQQNNLYTNVASYYEYIDRLLNIYAPPIRDCRLPQHPRNGNWTIDEQGKKTGDFVPFNTMLTIDCHKGYKLASSSNKIKCGSAFNMPTCQKLCPLLKFPNGTDFRCFNKANRTTDCSEAVHEIRLQYSCPDRYQIPNDTMNIRMCNKGSWGTPLPECVKPPKFCGQKINNTEGLEQPWNVLIYKNETEKSKENDTKPKYAFTTACGGCLISRRLVVTGAVCVFDRDKAMYPTEIYSIAVGKQYDKYDDPRDVGAQYSGVSEVMVHPSYKGIKRRYLGDMAVIVTELPFSFTGYVQPACYIDVDLIRLNGGEPALITIFKNGKHEDTNIIYKNEATCQKELPDTFSERYLILDKVCAGYGNDTPGLCSKDTGKGFTVKNPLDNRYYVRGVLSANPVTLVGDVITCDKNSLYTNTTFYYTFIDDLLSKYE